VILLSLDVDGFLLFETNCYEFWPLVRFSLAVLYVFFSGFSGCFAGLFIGRQVRLGFVRGEQNRGLEWRVVHDSL